MLALLLKCPKTCVQSGPCKGMKPSPGPGPRAASETDPEAAASQSGTAASSRCAAWLPPPHPSPRTRTQRPAESPRGHRHTEESGHVPSLPRACRAEGLLVWGRKTPLHLLRPAGGLKTKRAAATLTGDAFRSDRHWYLFVREAFAEQQREPRGAATTCARPNPVAPQGNPHPPTRTRNQQRGARGAVFPVCDCFMQLPSEAPFLCLGASRGHSKGDSLGPPPPWARWAGGVSTCGSTATVSFPSQWPLRTCWGSRRR